MGWFGGKKDDSPSVSVRVYTTSTNTNTDTSSSSSSTNIAGDAIWERIDDLIEQKVNNNYKPKTKKEMDEESDRKKKKEAISIIKWTLIITLSGVVITFMYCTYQGKDIPEFAKTIFTVASTLAAGAGAFVFGNKSK
ncbi:hypothetical protein [Klebsiella pneumoniae]|uniref:hypothetical protein n=1 Tax=Klebsiella pneumoniae TaxID=573 RepID=UPI001F03FCE5|nr:hypothetical protein [Klebsiella pneumoniae]